MVPKMKSSSNELNSNLKMAEGKVKEVEDRTVEIIHSEKEKDWKTVSCDIPS